MKKTLNKILMSIFLVFVVGSIWGCGGDSESENSTNAPSTRLISTVVSSSKYVDHVHTVAIPFSDLGSGSTVQFRSTQVNSHAHVIALSSLQLHDLQAGLRVVVTSSEALAHTHTWEIRGGNVLYDSMCYNCHTNDKRGTRGMDSSSLTSGQRDAIQNPDGAALSSAVMVIPDPNYNMPTTTASIDGAGLYSSNCAVCHGSLAVSTKHGRKAIDITNAIQQNKGGMDTLSNLSTAEIQAIADALK